MLAHALTGAFFALAWRLAHRENSAFLRVPALHARNALPYLNKSMRMNSFRLDISHWTRTQDGDGTGSRCSAFPTRGTVSYLFLIHALTVNAPTSLRAEDYRDLHNGVLMVRGSIL